jgi:long-chain acyl-CoA synthetase
MIKYTRQQIEELDKFYKHPRNLVDLFEDTVTKWGERNAIGTKNPQTKQYEWITYKRLAERINNVRSGIHQLGIHKGDAVGVIIGNSVEWYVLENASHGLGAIFVPMYEKELLEEGGKKNPVPSYKPHWTDPAELIYTSGTTGEPKGVLLSHGNLSACSQSGYHIFPSLNEKSVSLAILPWAHSYGLSAELHNFM